MSLTSKEKTKSKVECFEGHKPNAYGLKYALDCIEQE